jgi:hypothetical protein
MSQDLPKILRAIAATPDAKEKCNDFILNAAADEMDRNREALRKIATEAARGASPNGGMARRCIAIAQDALTEVE